MNYAAVDPHTAVHAVAGAALGRAGVGALPALAVTLVWENAEPGLKARYPGVFPSGSRDTARNKVGDIVAFVAGWALGIRSRAP